MGVTVRKPSGEPGTSPGRSVEMHIDELVLDGFDPDDGAAMSDAIGAELARRVERGEIPSAIEPGTVADQVVTGIEAGPAE